MTPKEAISKKTLGLFIITTMACNLTCSYCFENGKDRNVRLASNNVLAVYNFIEESLRQGQYEALDLTFTGGEPLYNYNFIETLTVMCSSNLVLPIKYSIITNGTILTPRIKKFLSNYAFDIQISFDGDRQYHNLERKNRLGKGTYDRIIANISKLLGERSLFVQVRINLSKTNFNGISSLLQDLSRFKEFPNFLVYTDFVAVSRDDHHYLSEWDKVTIFPYIIDEFEKLGLPYPRIIENGGYCMYKNDSSVTIHADGNLYNCYSVVGNETFVESQLSRGTLRLSGTGSLCSLEECPYYSYCYGGCPYNQYVKNGNMSRDCQKNYLDLANKALFLAEIGLLKNKMTVYLPKIKVKHSL